MADETNENRIRRMDLNLCLGLPRLPNRRGSDLGSDLALGSIPLPGEEIHVSAEISSLIEVSSDSHAPYSPSHASYTPTSQPVEPLNPDENPQFEYSPYTPSPQNVNEPLVRSVLEYSPYFPHIPVRHTSPESIGQDVNEPVEHVPYSPSYAPALPPTRGVESLRQDGESHVPYSPSYIPLSTTGQDHDDNSNGSDLPLALEFNGPFRPTVDTSEPLVQNGSSQAELQRFSGPGDRFQRLIESNRRFRIRRFRSASYRADPDFSAFSLGTDGVFHDVMESDRTVETSGTHKESAKREDVEEGETKEQSSSTANFDCNVCLDVAKEPVVTSCGHLFCWPCLYQWLHLHCDHKECPVCKGEVTGSNVTPIYGRGSSEIVAEKNKGCEEGDSSLKIPPRPSGRRVESLRQQIRRPLRRSGEEFSSWRRIVDEEIRNGNRVERLGESRLSRIFDDARVYSMLRTALHLHREDNLENGLNSGGSGLSVNATQNGGSSQLEIHGESNSSPLQDGIDILDRTAFYSFPTSGRLASQTAGVSSVVGRISNNDYSGASASVNLPNSMILHGHGTQGTPAADQASNSSTMAVIQGDGGVHDASAEPNSVVSSRSLRRSRRNGASGSLDVDGGLHHARKRRRLD